jgi:hypothetical protein
MKKSWQYFLIALAITVCMGGAGLLLVWGAASMHRQPTPIPTPQRPAAQSTQYRPIPWASVAPTPTRTHIIVAATQTPAFRWVDLPEYGLRFELPDDWSHRTASVANDCAIGGPLAKVTTEGPAGDYLEISIQCQIPGLHRLGPCYSPVVLNEERHIYREYAPQPMTVYSEYTYKNNEMQCPLFGWAVGAYWVSGAYYNRQTFEPNFPVVDRIMLSVQVK